MDDTYLTILDQEFTLETETIEDSFESSIARHELPYRDGALLEDMGQKARTVRIRCYFINENYAAHKDLINYLGYTDDLHELQHPEYGLIKGKIESIIVRHDDRLQTAEVDLTYVENLRGVIDPEPATSVAADVEAAFVDGQTELTEEIRRDLAEQLGADAAGILDTVVAAGAGLYEQISGLSGAAQAYVRAADTYVKTLDAKLRAITNPANGLIAVIDYAANLPGYVAGSIANTVERYAILAESAVSFPARLVDNFHNAVDEIADAPGTYQKYAKISSAQRSAHLAATIFKADKEVSDRQKRAQATASFSPLGRRLSPQETDQILTVNEMERILAAVRTQLQEAINLSRNMPSLRKIAEALTDHVRQMKLERPKVIAVEVDNSLPLHLVCLKYGMTTADAEQLMTINTIRHPNYVTGEVNVYAR
jgi:prophage DNA circulation protein